MYLKQQVSKLLTLLFLLLSISVVAEEKADTSAWQFEITPYLFGAGLDGKVGVSTGIGDVTADVDASFSDILENLDSGFMALFEARKGKWMYSLEGVYFCGGRSHRAVFISVPVSSFNC